VDASAYARRAVKGGNALIGGGEVPSVKCGPIKEPS